MKGDRQFNSVDVELRSTVEEFNATLAYVGHSVAFKAFEVGKSTLERVEGNGPNMSFL